MDQPCCGFLVLSCICAYQNSLLVVSVASRVPMILWNSNNSSAQGFFGERLFGQYGLPCDYDFGRDRQYCMPSGEEFEQNCHFVLR